MIWHLLPIFSAFCASFAFTFSLMNLLIWRRYRRISAVLQEICVQAYLMRHMPIWVAWSEMTGIGFTLVPTPHKMMDRD